MFYFSVINTLTFFFFWIIKYINLCFIISFLYRRNLEQAGERESLMLEGDIGGGLVIERQISFPEDYSNIFRIDSRILARTVGAGSGGFSRFTLGFLNNIVLIVSVGEW